MAQAAGRRSSTMITDQAVLIITGILLTSSSWNLEVTVEASYDGTIREARCSPNWDDSQAMKDEINLITNTLISQTNPRPPPEYLCAVPYLGDPAPYVWGGSSCADRITKEDCGECLRVARDALVSSAYCEGRPGAHMYTQDCAIRYENYAFCHN